MTDVHTGQRRPISCTQRFAHYFVRLNLYRDDESLNEEEQFLSTRIFFALLIAAVIVLLTFTGLQVPMQTSIIASPSLSTFEYLSDKYYSTLSCRCTQSIISYEKFISFSPRYHQICSSLLIEFSWISTLFALQPGPLYALDFRTAAFSQFQVLDYLCRFAQQSVNDSLKSFLTNQLSTVSVLSRTVFDQQSKSLVQQMQSASVADANLIDSFAIFTIAQNYLSSSIRTSNYFQYDGNIVWQNSQQYLWDVKNWTGHIADFCFCYETYQCNVQSILYNLTEPYRRKYLLWPPQSPYYVPGMKAGCIPHDSLLNSTLECFYNATCIETTMQLMGSSYFPDPLNAELKSRFSLNATVGSMFSELFIENWNYNNNYTSYFSICAPMSCAYSHAGTFDAAHMFIKFFGFFGGTAVILLFIAAFLVKFILRPLKRMRAHLTARNESTSSTVHDNAAGLGLRRRLCIILLGLKKSILKFNVFKMTLSDQTGIWATRIYLILLVAGFCILTIYTSITLQTFTITRVNPTFSDFQNLHTRYSSWLSCPCSSISVAYSSFVSLRPRFHAICSSDFVDENTWLLYFKWNYRPNASYFTTPNIALNLYEFRFLAQNHFFFLVTLCQLANTIVENAIIIFNNTQLVSAEPLFDTYFFAQTKQIIQQFEQQTLQSFLGLIKFMRFMVRDNQLLSASATNFIEEITTNGNASIITYQSQITYTDENTTCSCGTNLSCAHVMGIYCSLPSCLNASNPRMIVPGFMMDCLPVESVLSSTLECLYNQSCVQQLIDLRTFDLDLWFLPFNMNITALDPNLPSQFSPKTKLEVIVSQLLVEEWINTTDPIAHYEQCRPKTCTYTYTGRSSVLYVFASVLGVLGGLSIVLRLTVPVTAHVSGPLKRKWTRYVTQIRRQESLDVSPGNEVNNNESQLRRFTIFIRQSILSLSRFHNEVNQPILATTIYFGLIGISFLIILVFSALGQELHSYTVKTPSQTIFSKLAAEYKTHSLSCPCNQISMPYAKLLNLSTVYHQVCHSDIIYSDWWVLLFGDGDVSIYQDQPLLSTYFRMLSSMCTLAMETVQNAVDVFLASSFVSLEVLDQRSFQDQIDASVKSLKEQTPMKFRRMLQLIRESFRANQIEDLFMSSWTPVFKTAAYLYIEQRNPVSFNNGSCLCATSMYSSCVRPLTFTVHASNLSTDIHLPGLVGGWLAMDGLRMSTLECLFTSTCMSIISSLVNGTTIPSHLDSTIATRFPAARTTVGAMTDELFIEQWFNSSNYSEYYQTCSPKACSYQLVESNSIVYMITLLLGVYGGLTTSIRALVSGGLLLFHHLWHSHIGHEARILPAPSST